MVDVWWHYRVQSGFSVQPNWNIKAATHVTSSGYSHQLRSMEHVMCAQAQRTLTSPHPTNTREQMRSIQHVRAAKNVSISPAHHQTNELGCMGHVRGSASNVNILPTPHTTHTLHVNIFMFMGHIHTSDGKCCVCTTMGLSDVFHRKGQNENKKRDLRVSCDGECRAL